MDTRVEGALQRLRDGGAIYIIEGAGPAEQAASRAYLAASDVRPQLHPGSDTAAGTTYMSHPCPMCGATGTLPGDHGLPDVPEECSACFGTGRIPTLGEVRARRERAHGRLALAEGRIRHARARLAESERSYAMATADGGLEISGYELNMATGERRPWVGGLDEVAGLMERGREALDSMEADLPELRENVAYWDAEYAAMQYLTARVKEAVKAWDDVGILMEAYEVAGPQALLPAPAAPAAKPPECRTPGCRKEPREWDAQGRGWCRRHAHRRGLHRQP